MPDKLHELFDDWALKPGANQELFSAFQGGFSTAAVSMRQRAMDAVDEAMKLNSKNSLIMKALNDLKNKIGSLADIPQ